MYSLFMTFRSPYARKVRIALLEKKIPFEEISINLFDKPTSFLQRNILGTVPSLQISDSLTLYDSTEILHYLEDKHPSPSLISQDEETKWQIWNMEEMADRLCDAFVKVFFERQKENPDTSILKKADLLLETILNAVQTRLEHQPFLFGHFSLADISLGSVLKWMDFRLQISFKDQAPSFQEWYQRLNQRESFQQTIPRLD